jgi:hypothetical protein
MARVIPPKAEKPVAAETGYFVISSTSFFSIENAFRDIRAVQPNAELYTLD